MSRRVKHFPGSDPGYDERFHHDENWDRDAACWYVKEAYVCIILHYTDPKRNIYSDSYRKRIEQKFSTVGKGDFMRFVNDHFNVLLHKMVKFFYRLGYTFPEVRWDDCGYFLDWITQQFHYPLSVDPVKPPYQNTYPNLFLELFDFVTVFEAKIFGTDKGNLLYLTEDDIKSILDWSVDFRVTRTDPLLYFLTRAIQNENRNTMLKEAYVRASTNQARPPKGRVYGECYGQVYPSVRGFRESQRQPGEPVQLKEWAKAASVDGRWE